jgi:hypothetical protein
MRLMKFERARLERGSFCGVRATDMPAFERLKIPAERSRGY